MALAAATHAITRLRYCCRAPPALFDFGLVAIAPTLMLEAAGIAPEPSAHSA